MDRRQAAVMRAQFNNAVKAYDENIKFYIDETNPSVWHILLCNFPGDEDEFSSGEYLVRMEAPPKFPYEPPHFYFLTPNGVYDINTKVCIHIGEFHKDQYRAALGMAGFAKQLISGMIGWKTLGHGISIISTSAAEKKRLALESKAYNAAKHSGILNGINVQFEGYSSKWDKSKIPEWVQVGLGLSAPVGTPTNTDLVTSMNKLGLGEVPDAPSA